MEWRLRLCVLGWRGEHRRWAAGCGVLPGPVHCCAAAAPLSASCCSG